MSDATKTPSALYLFCRSKYKFINVISLKLQGFLSTKFGFVSCMSKLRVEMMPITEN